MLPVISGIQQIGIGVSDVHETFEWYRKHMGMDILVFDESAEAGLMLPYTDGKPQRRHAKLAINIQGGGGLEIWQYTSRKPQPPSFQLHLGDLGVLMAKYKTRDAHRSYEFLNDKGVDILSEIIINPAGKNHFYFKDPYGNLGEITETDNWFKSYKTHCGGVYGCVIGVSDIEKAKAVYSDILGHDEVLYDQTRSFEEYSQIPGGGDVVRRVLLKNSQKRVGAFGRLLGDSEIELIQVLDRRPNRIFENRLWGDLGYIHLCFDIRGMDALRTLCDSRGFPFTVDSSESFDMGEAAGHFAYIEDPDGTLVEFVETHKVPIVKKLNLFLNLRNRLPEKPLPDWMVSALAINRVRN